MDAKGSRRSSGPTVWSALFLTVVLVAGCGSTTVTSTSGPSAAASPTASSSVPSLAPSRTSTDPFVGQAVVTVSPDLRVRSQPRVADDSDKYEPLLPTGTELTVIGGPVSASGYLWYEVIPVDVTLADGHGSGWVAAADKDGTPWIALRTATGPTAELAVSSVARASADPAKATQAAASINAFGVDLYKRMLADGTLKPAKGGVISPTSIVLALAMARAGAKGETAAQIDRVVHTSGWEALGPELNALDQALTALNATWSESEYAPDAQGNWGERSVTHKLALRIANAAFAQRSWSIEAGFLDRIAATFGAGLRLVDFIADSQAARQIINNWVSERTEKRIPELIPKPLVTPQTRLVLTNAIYLKANWAKEFSLGQFDLQTEPAAFRKLDGSTIQVPMMAVRGEQDIPYARGTGWQAVDLAYRGRPDPSTGTAPRPLAMTVILPADLKGFEKSLSAGQLARIVTALERERTRLVKDVTDVTMEGPCGCGCYPYSVDLFMPRFGIDNKLLLAEPLKAAGMPLAFDWQRADFTGIHVPTNDEPSVFISEVVHQANIDVDEKGTEAAAATAVVVDVGGCTGPGPAKEITLRLDRPFFFVLRDVATGAVLFMGRVVDPSVRG